MSMSTVIYLLSRCYKATLVCLFSFWRFQCMDSFVYFNYKKIAVLKPMWILFNYCKSIPCKTQYVLRILLLPYLMKLNIYMHIILQCVCHTLKMLQVWTTDMILACRVDFHQLRRKWCQYLIDGRAYPCTEHGLAWESRLALYLSQAIDSQWPWASQLASVPGSSPVALR